MRPIGTLLAVCALVLSGAAAAHADTETFRDKRGDVKSGNDIIRYVVKNARRISITTTSRNLKAGTDRFIAPIDTDGDARAEWELIGFFGGPVRLNKQDGTRKPCPGAKIGRSLAKDTARLSLPRRCINGPRRIRVQLLLSWNETLSHDLAPNKGWSGAVRR